ncbi:phage protein NinX family protein [Proteus mirabilis]
MNKYTEMSDLEINKRVFVAAKIEHEDTDLHSNKVFYGDGANWIEFNPCNNPSDAMPIIIENNISLHAPHLRGGWMAECTGSGDDVNDGLQADYFDAHHKNPLRAAMEVFLMMKDAENEKV